MSDGNAEACAHADILQRTMGADRRSVIRHRAAGLAPGLSLALACKFGATGAEGMRALLADHDRVMLEAVRRAIGSSSGITLDIASSKQECIELLHAARCEVLIACERLTDGSGLELLGQVARRSPATLRIFAAEPARLALLIGGRLTPFRLYQTLPYPIAADVLLPLLVQARAHSLESVLPTATLRTRLTQSARSRSAAEPPPAPPPPATPAPAIQSDVPCAQHRNIGHRRLLIGTTLLLSAALVLLV